MAPGKKDHPINVRVTEEDYQAAKQAAKAQGRTLPEMIQGFLHMLGLGETPPGWPPKAPGSRRAHETRPRRRRRGEPPEEPPAET